MHICDSVYASAPLFGKNFVTIDQYRQKIASLGRREKRGLMDTRSTLTARCGVLDQATEASPKTKVFRTSECICDLFAICTSLR